MTTRVYNTLYLSLLLYFASILVICPTDLKGQHLASKNATDLSLPSKIEIDSWIKKADTDFMSSFNEVSPKRDSLQRIAKQYIDKTYEAAKAMNYETGIAKAQGLLSKYYLYSSEIDVEKAKQLLIQNISLNQQLQCISCALSDMGALVYLYEYRALNVDSILYYNRLLLKDEHLKILLEQEDYRLIYNTYYSMANTYIRHFSNRDSSGIYFKKALALEEAYDLKLCYAFHGDIANLLYQGNYVDAIVQTKKFIECADKAANMNAKVGALQLLADIYRDLNLYAKAVEQFALAKVATEQVGMKGTYYYNAINELICADKIPGQQLSLAQIEQLLDLHKKCETETPCGCMHTSNLIGDLLVERAYDSLAIPFLTAQMEQANACNMMQFEIRCMSLLGEVYFEQGAYDKSRKLVVDAYEKAASLGSKNKGLLNITRKARARIATHFEEAEMIDSLWTTYTHIRDSFNTVSLNNVAAYTSSITEQQNRLELLERDNEILRLEQDKSKIAGIALLVIIGVLLALLALVLNRRKIVRNNQQLIQNLNAYFEEILTYLGKDQERASFSTQEELSKHKTALLGWKEEVLQLDQDNAKSLLSSARFENISQALKNKLIEQADLLETTKSIYAQKEEELQSFNYTVGHDLKLPLINAKHLIDLLLAQSGQLDKNVRWYLKEFERTILNMEDMINGINAYSKADHLELMLTEISLHTLFVQIGQSLKRSKQLTETATLEIAADLPVICGDELMLRQVFTNLLSNAAKFSRHQEQSLIRVAAREEQDKVKIIVEDNGVGIPRAQQRKIFDLFTRVHPHKDFEGTGAGLAIAKRMVEKHDGRIEVESEEGAGTKMIVCLPKVMV